MSNLHIFAYNALMETSPSQKALMAASLYQQQCAGELTREDDTDNAEIIRIDSPGRPNQPELVPPNKVKQRKLSSLLGRITLIHAITHIEFNAINLALDAVYRFRDMPDQFYTDWLHVASEEAKHFTLLRERLNKLDYDYGDFPAHNGLWEMAVKTDHDVLIRMALVPRVLEARGLDVTPGMMEKLKQVGDHETTEILAIILEEEIGHVAIGSRWYAYSCQQQGVEPISTFRTLIQSYMKGSLRGPFNQTARIQAGFSEQEMLQLEHMLTTF